MSKGRTLPATLAANLFWLDWSASLTPELLHHLGARFVVRYRDGRRPTSVPLDF
jgi:hypothetical protein